MSTRDAKVMQYDLKKKQRVEDFASNLPCIPDNILHVKEKGVFTIGCAFKRTKPFSMMDFLSDKPLIRSILLRITSIFPVAQKLIPKGGYVLFLDDETGEIVGTWNDVNAKKVDVVSEAYYSKENNLFFFGSWRNPWLNVLKVIKKKDFFFFVYRLIIS